MPMTSLYEWAWPDSCLAGGTWPHSGRERRLRTMELVIAHICHLRSLAHLVGQGLI